MFAWGYYGLIARLDLFHGLISEGGGGIGFRVVCANTFIYNKWQIVLLITLCLRQMPFSASFR